MKPRRRLLFVSPRFLFPMDEGGKIRTGNVLRCMKGGAFEVVLVSPAPPDPAPFAGEIAACSDRFLHWPAPVASRARRLGALAGSLPLSVATDRSAAGRRVIADVLATQPPDLVVVDFPHADVLMPARLAVRSVVFTHNVEAEIYERHAARARGAMRLVWSAQARKMARFEGRTLRDRAAVIAVSARDSTALAARYGITPPRVIDTGVDLVYFAELPQPGAAAAPTLLFTGVMDSPANIDGIGFLMDQIWPLVVAARPDARVLVIGRNPQPALLRIAQERGLPWCFTGSVADIRPHVAKGLIAVIPLRVGSGTRLKAFEAMAMGRPVVSTTIGVEGLDVIPGRHVLCADDPAGFAAAILRLIEDAALREKMVRDARALLEKRFSWQAVARQFEAICLDALTSPARA